MKSSCWAGLRQIAEGPRGGDWPEGGTICDPACSLPPEISEARDGLPFASAILDTFFAVSESLESRVSSTELGDSPWEEYKKV